MLQQWPLLALLVPPKVVRKALVVLGGQRGQQYARWSGSQRWSHDCRNQVQASDVGQLESCPSLCRFLKLISIYIYKYCFHSYSPALKEKHPVFCVEIPLKKLHFFCCYNLPRGKKVKAFASKSEQRMSLARACYYSMCTPQATQTYIYIYILRICVFVIVIVQA